MSDSLQTPRTAACQASLSITNSGNLLKLMSIELVMPSNHLILCCPLLLPSIFPSVRVFSNASILHIRWPKYLSFSFHISPSNEYSGLMSLILTGLKLNCRSSDPHKFHTQLGKGPISSLMVCVWGPATCRPPH